MPFPKGSIHEAGYMVRDIHAAIDNWMTVLGAGPFFLGKVHIPAERGTNIAVCPVL